MSYHIQQLSIQHQYFNNELINKMLGMKYQQKSCLFNLSETKFNDVNNVSIQNSRINLSLQSQDASSILQNSSLQIHYNLDNTKLLQEKQKWHVKFFQFNKYQKASYYYQLINEIQHRIKLKIFHNQIKCQNYSLCKQTQILKQSKPFRQNQIYKQANFCRLKPNRLSMFFVQSWQAQVDKFFINSSYQSSYQSEKQNLFNSVTYYINRSYFNQKQWKQLQGFIMTQDSKQSIINRLIKLNYFQFAYDLLKLTFKGKAKQFLYIIKSQKIEEMNKQFKFDSYLTCQQNEAIISQLNILINSCNLKQDQSIGQVNQQFSKLKQLFADIISKEHYYESKSQNQYLKSQKPAKHSIHNVQNNQNQNNSINQESQQAKQSSNWNNSSEFYNDRTSILNNLNITDFDNSFDIQNLISQGLNISFISRYNYQNEILEQLQKEKKLLQKVQKYGEFVDISYQYYRKHLSLDFYQSQLKAINLKTIVSSPLIQLQYINFGMYPIKTQGLRLIMSVEWPNLIGFQAWCCCIDTLKDSNLQKQPKLQFLSISFNPFKQDTIQYFKSVVFKTLKAIRITFETYQLWKMFNQIYLKTFPQMITLFIRNKDSQLNNRIGEQIQNSLMFRQKDNINFRKHKPKGLSFQPVVILDQQ